MENFFALIIGVGGTNIPETVGDAKAIHDVLADYSKGAYEPVNTFLLTENKSTKSEIIKAFDEIIEKSSRDSTVFIYYSGHGQKFLNPTTNAYDYYLITHGANRDNKEDTMLNGNIFSDKVAQIKAGRLLIMLDCCYAGGMGTLKIKDGETEPLSNKGLHEKLQGGKGRVFISSCDDDETSVILPGAVNSLFTAVALEVLNGFFSQNREYVSVLDLIDNVLKKVPQRIAKFNHSQTPILTAAEGLNHKYFVCKNGEWNQPVSPLTITLKELNIGHTEETPNMDVANFEGLDTDDKDIVNKFFKQMNLENNVQTKDKIGFINDVGGLKNFKEINKKINKIKFNGTAHGIRRIDTKNILNVINEQIDEQNKLDFIKNYKNKI
jgi:hypothetical protein